MIHWLDTPQRARWECAGDDPTETVSGDPRDVTCPRCRLEIRREGEADHRRDQAKDRRATGEG